MSDLNLTNSTYQTGTQDTATTLVDNVDTVQAQHQNGPNSAIIQIETILGNGPTLKGTKTDLATRLAVSLNTDGTIIAPIAVGTGGTGVVTVPAGAVLAGNVTSALVNSGTGSSGQVLLSGGSSAPSWGSGLIFQAPGSVGTGSTRSHEGAVTISVNQNLSGTHFYTTFVLNSGITLTLPTGSKRLVIIATSSITINGIINASGAGGLGTQAIGQNGTDQPGGNGNTVVSQGWAAGDVVCHGCVVVSGGGGQVAGSTCGVMLSPIGAMGGSAGGASSDGVNPIVSGGNGGGSIVLIAPTITLAATATLNTSGSGGSTSGAGAGSGGGGAGNVYILTHSFTDNGATYTQTGGGGGSGAGSGAAGIKQINIY